MSVKREMWLMCPCGCEEYSQKTVVEHMERVHPEMLFKCNANQCGRLFWKLCDLKEHIVKSDNHRNFRRDHENLFNIEEFLDKQSHSYKRQFLGLKASNSKLATEGLIEYPVDLKEYRCRVCKANKSHFSSFLFCCATRHVKNIHPTQPSMLRQIKYKCRDCGRDDFSTDSDLQNHIELSHGPALQISTKSRLSPTIKTDSESEIQIMEVKSVSATESWYESSAPQPSGPPIHSVPTHENGDGDAEICHPCSFCKSRIPEWESSFHLKIHYDELFKCDICQLGFEEYRKVVQHLKTIHKVGERFRGLIGLPMQTKSLAMLKCGVEDCGRKFIGQQNEMDIMMKHVTKSHGQYVASVNNVRFFCRICEDLETFDSLADVEAHIKYKHRRQLVTLNSSSEEDNKKVSPLPQRNRREDHADEPPRKVIIVEEPRKCTIKESKHNHKQSRRNDKPSQRKQEKAKKREKKKYRKDDNDFKVKSKHHAITKLRSSKNSKTRSRLNKVKCQPKWPKLIKEVPTAAIKELLENVTTATVVASTIEKKLKRNKTKLESESRYSKSKSSSITESSTYSESETEVDSETNSSFGKDSTSNSDLDTREDSSKLQKRKPKTKININSALLKRMNNNITLEERLAYCLGKYKTEEKISEITGETLGKNNHTILDKLTDGDDQIQRNFKMQLSDTGDSESGMGKVGAIESGEKELKIKDPDEDDQMSKDVKERSTPAQNCEILKDGEQCSSADDEILNQTEESSIPVQMPMQDKTFNENLKQACLEKIYHKPEMKTQNAKTGFTSKIQYPFTSTLLYCEFCVRQFPNASSICGHIYKDHGSMLFRCKMCTSHDMLVSGFVSTRGLLNHLRKGHGLKGLPGQLLGNESLVELPDKFLQKIVCVRDGCKGSAEIGRSGLWLGRDLADAKAQIVEHNLFRHKTVTVGDKIELHCRVCSKFCLVYSRDDEYQENQWRTHCAQNHSKLLNFKSGLDRKKIIFKISELKK